MVDRLRMFKLWTVEQAFLSVSSEMPPPDKGKNTGPCLDLAAKAESRYINYSELSGLRWKFPNGFKTTLIEIMLNKIPIVRLLLVSLLGIASLLLNS